jgi:hypothetical protein
MPRYRPVHPPTLPLNTPVTGRRFINRNLKDAAEALATKHFGGFDRQRLLFITQWIAANPNEDHELHSGAMMLHQFLRNSFIDARVHHHQLTNLSLWSSHIAIAV